MNKRNVKSQKRRKKLETGNGKAKRRKIPD